MKILLIEDEYKIANAIKTGLEQEHFIVDIAYSGKDGYDMAVDGGYDLMSLIGCSIWYNQFRWLNYGTKYPN